MSYSKHAELLSVSSVYFSTKLSRIVNGLNSKRTDWTFGSGQPSLLQLWDSNEKINFFVHNNSKADSVTSKDCTIAYYGW